MSGVKQIVDFAIELTSKLPAPLEGMKACIYTSPLVNRVSSNWKVMLMDLGTVIVIISLFAAFISGATFLCVVFSILTLSSATGSFYMRRFETQASLEAIVTNLKEEKDKVTRELNQHIASLTLQMNELRKSSQDLLDGAQKLQVENREEFGRQINTLKNQTDASHKLCDYISQRMKDQQEGLGEQITYLTTIVTELHSQDGILQKIQQLTNLNELIFNATQRLNECNLAIGRLEGTYKALQQLNEELNLTSQLLKNNTIELSDQVNGLFNQRQRIETVLQHYFPGVFPLPLGNAPQPRLTYSQVPLLANQPYNQKLPRPTNQPYTPAPSQSTNQSDVIINIPYKE